tara:strand:- start:28478 stop:28924 length:447 start_codon:yes stop_codon:yes gene_type:complete
MNIHALNLDALTWTALGSCLVLAVFAFFLFRRLKRFESRQAKQQDDRHEHWSESARIVALAVVQDQCEPSEGCLRLRYILAQLGESRELLERMGDELAHFATHKERKQLPVQERHKQDRHRFMIEEKYSGDLKILCREIAATYDFRGA